MAAHQAPPSLGFSRQEHWSGLPFPSPMRESEVTQSCPTLSVPMDGSPPGSSVHGIFQARVLEWDAIAFSDECSRQCKHISLGLAENWWEISWFALGWGCVSCVCLNCSLTWQPQIVCKDRSFPVYHSVPCLSQGPAHSGHSQVVSNEFSEASSWSLIKTRSLNRLLDASLLWLQSNCLRKKKNQSSLPLRHWAVSFLKVENTSVSFLKVGDAW